MDFASLWFSPQIQIRKNNQYPEHWFLRELRGLRIDLLVKEPDEVVVNGLVAIVLGSLLNTQLVPQPEQAVQSFSYCSLQRNRSVTV